MIRRLAPLAVAAAILPVSAWAQTVSTVADRGGLVLTVTQGDLGMVRDRRSVALDKGASELVIEGVAREARPGSGMLSAPGLMVREQGFELDALAPDTLLERSLGQEVTVVFADKEERARVLAAGPVPVFLIGGKVVAGQPSRVLFDALPPGMRAAPVWRAAITADNGGRREAELTYLTGGLTWTPDYTAELAEDKMTLSAWATVTNASGADYANASLRVIAGTLNQAPAPRPRKESRGQPLMMAAAPMMEPARETAGIHHLYTVAQPVTLLAGATRQVALMAPATLPVERLLVLDPLPPHLWRNPWSEPEIRHPVAQLRFKNTLGQPLPAGTVRVMARAKDGTLVLQGEDRLEAVPDAASGRIDMGEAFDVTARRVQTDFQRVAPEVAEAEWEVRLSNGGDKPAKVTVREQFGGEWLIVDESAKHLRDGGMGAAWTVTVPAKGDGTLKYRVRVKGS